MLNRSAFWILLVLASIAATVVGVRYFPDAFSIVALDITMDRERALADARAIMEREGFGPRPFRQAASFSLDQDTQTFVELEGGGKDALTHMLGEGLYAAYTWRVRQFREGEANETSIRFTPEGQPYGFVERLEEDAPGPALDAVDARRRAEAGARSAWQVDLNAFNLVEHGQERRPGGRVDHTFTYERPQPTLNEGRYRLRLVVSGDRLTEVTHFVWIPEGFTRRFASMRSANQAIGVGSAVGLILLYVMGGIGVGLFFMLRDRWVIARPAVVWGLVVGLLQSLAILNEWPLLWMAYDTAVSRSTFIVRQITTVVASSVGFSAFFALSFMAAESLTRRAYGTHPQFWKVWAREPGSSTAILGRTSAGFLLVSIFFAYEVGLYLFATRSLGWWTPSETLLHPDVLATYVPWLSAIANSLQAGFWEECLFRAVPIAGAALIGERVGRRRLFVVLAFVVQAVIFGAGHAPYPTQPSFARPVELLIPSIGFGLLYVYFGLLPAIVLHFAFDVVWFALPIFLSDAPGIRFQQAMVVLVTLVPLWIVLWRRAQAGGWTTLSPANRNEAWIPPAAPAAEAAPAPAGRLAIHPHLLKAWPALGAISLLIVVVALFTQSSAGALAVSRNEAAAIARRALEARGVELGPTWMVMPSPDDGSGGPHEFVATTAGPGTRQALLGQYLPTTRWIVRVATFEGDVAERAEEWRVFVGSTGDVRRIEHRLPEGRPGASLAEEAARQLAHAALAERTGLNVHRGDVREVSANPSKLTARTDWTFTFTDTTAPTLPQGEARASVDIAGDEVVAVRRFVFVPEEWQRQAENASSRNFILQIASGVVFGGLLVAAAVGGVLAWSRHRYSAGLFLAGAALMFLVSAANSVNSWPTVLAGLPTAAPLNIQIVMFIGLGFVGLSISAVLVGLALGSVPHGIADGGRLADRDAVRLSVALGLFGAAVAALASWLRTPAWDEGVALSSVGTVVPFLSVAIGPVSGFLMRTAIVLSALATVDRVTEGWNVLKPAGAAVLAIIGFLGVGAPAGLDLGGWLAASIVTAVALPFAYVALLRFDLTLVPLALGVMAAIGALSRGLQRPFPIALPASLAAVATVLLVAWWWFRAMRRHRDRAAAGADTPVTVS